MAELFNSRLLTAAASRGCLRRTGTRSPGVRLLARPVAPGTDGRWPRCRALARRRPNGYGVEDCAPAGAQTREGTPRPSAASARTAALTHEMPRSGERGVGREGSR